MNAIDPVPGWTVERFEKATFKVFCTHDDGTVEIFTIMSVVKMIGGPDEITIRIVPPRSPQNDRAGK